VAPVKRFRTRFGAGCTLTEKWLLGLLALIAIAVLVLAIVRR